MERSRTLHGKVVIYVVLSVGSLYIIFPFLWMVSTSFKLPGDVYLFPPRWIPSPGTLQNYVSVFTSFPFPVFLLNSAKIAVLNVLGQLASCALAAYPLAKIKFPGRRTIFVVVLVTLLIPYQSRLVPLFIELGKGLGWNDNQLPLIVPAFLGSSFGVFLLRQFFLSIPDELIETARIEGVSPFGTFLRVAVPMSYPGLAALGVITFFNSWNDFLTPLIFLHTISKMTVTVGLAFFVTQAGPEWGVLMAGTVLSVLPLAIVFLALRRFFVEGISFTGVKG